MMAGGSDTTTGKVTNGGLEADPAPEAGGGSVRAAAGAADGERTTSASGEVGASAEADEVGVPGAPDEVGASAEADEVGRGADGADDPPPPEGARAATHEPMSVDASALKALAHPLRVRMYDLLADMGPATASQLAERVGESSGTTSYHLRLLAKHGFIEEDAERGNKRDRYWKVRGYNLEAASMLDDPEAVADLRIAAGELWRNYARQIETWFRTADTWGPTWMSASASSMMRAYATPEEIAELRAEVLQLLSRFAERFQDRDPPEGSARVVAQFHLFPLGSPEDNPPKGS